METALLNSFTELKSISTEIPSLPEQEDCTVLSCELEDLRIGAALRLRAQRFGARASTRVFSFFSEFLLADDAGTSGDLSKVAVLQNVLLPLRWADIF